MYDIIGDIHGYAAPHINKKIATAQEAFIFIWKFMMRLTKT